MEHHKRVEVRVDINLYTVDQLILCKTKTNMKAQC